MSTPLQPYHIESRNLMKKDLFLEAAMTLKKGLASDPEMNLLALVDLASCYYMLSDYVNFSKYTQKSYLEFQKQGSSLCLDQQMALALGLGRLLEEIGSVGEALKLYDLPVDYSTSSRTIKILAQKLRLLSELGLNDQLRLLYISCQQMFENKSDQDIDLKNALLFTDFYLYGEETCLNRYFQNHSSVAEQNSDQRLLFFNILYLFIVSQRPIAQKMQNELSKFNYFECDAYEKCLYDIALMQINKLPYQNLDLTRAGELSPFCSIRFIKCLSTIYQSQSVFLLRREFMQVIEHISKESKQLITKAFPLPEQKITIELANHQLICSNLKIDLNQSRNSFELLSLFINNPKISLEKACEFMYQSTLDLNYQHRLRMAISRLNKNISSQLGVNYVIKMNKADMSLTSELNIIKRAS